MHIILPSTLACTLPALVTLIALQSFKSFKSQPQGIQTFLSILIAFIVLDFGKILILKYTPWLFLADRKDLILIVAISTIPIALITSGIFRICKKVYFAEQSQETLLALAILLTVLTLAFMALEMHTIQAVEQIIR